jgi:xanthine dehydrogenase accessory factor
VIVLVRGVGDIGSAVAHHLFRAGYGIVMHDDPQPTTTRRGMAFADAVFDGQATLYGVRAMQVEEMDQVRGRRLPNARRSQSTDGPSGL